MIKCPKCKELISEELDKCPFCFTQIMASEVLNYRKEVEKGMDEKLAQGYIINRKRFKIAIVLSVLTFFMLLIPIVMIAVVPDEHKIMYGKFLIGYIMAYIVILYIVIIKLKVNVCAHCNQYKFFFTYNIFLGGRNRCPRCGRTLYKSI